MNPIDERLELKLKSIIVLADAEIAQNQPAVGDTTNQAANKLAAVAYWTAVKAQADGFYAL
jgi:predicted transposase YbfD/YdcC